MQSETQPRPTELRYRIADFINDRLKKLPAVHAATKAALVASSRRKQIKAALVASSRRKQIHEAEPAAPVAVVTEPEPESEPARRSISREDLPFPPVEMRKLVGTDDAARFDNPTHGLVYPYLAPELYESFFDFGCGCGRVARQLIQQQPSPQTYVGIDLHAGMIRWCQNNLEPAAPGFSFFYHDVFDVRFNPTTGAPNVAPFPVGDAEFTLVNAHSVFTHLTQEQAEHYMRECARILRTGGVLHASWFLFDKREFPMLGPSADALYKSYAHPGAAVMYDRAWVRATGQKFGLRISQIRPPAIRGFQWVLIMTKRTDIEEPEFPPDTAPYGECVPLEGAGFDVSKIGVETGK